MKRPGFAKYVCYAMMLAFVLLTILACAGCASKKPNVDITIHDDGKGTKHVTGKIPEPSNPISFVLSLGGDALKLMFPGL